MDGRRRLILFDVDGTLVRAAGAGRRALGRAFLEVFDVDTSLTGARDVRFEGRTDPAIIADMAAAAGISAADLDAGADRLRLAYLRALEDEMARPDPRRAVVAGVIPLLEVLIATRGVHLGLLTGNIEAGARIKLRAFGLNDFFADGGFASDHPDRAQIARIAREKLSRRAGIPFTADETVVVGDTDHDVACARANGYRAVVVDSGFVPRARLDAAAPDALFADFTQEDRVLAALGIEPG
jgi:phosphoglycolate phosphatase-like HAD superfamily hydrolase